MYNVFDKIYTHLQWDFFILTMQNVFKNPNHWVILTFFFVYSVWNNCLIQTSSVKLRHYQQRLVEQMKLGSQIRLDVRTKWTCILRKWIRYKFRQYFLSIYQHSMLKLYTPVNVWSSHAWLRGILKNNSIAGGRTVLHYFIYSWWCSLFRRKDHTTCFEVSTWILVLENGIPSIQKGQELLIRSFCIQ